MNILSRPVSAAGTLRVLAALLAYPDARMRGHLAEMRAILRREEALSAACREAVEALIAAVEGTDPLEAEAGYVQLFDCGRATSLHLFEHVHGESRDRGPAMIDLAQTYEKAGLFLAPGELPDYLPAVLEFVSTQPAKEAKAFLGEMAHILNGLHGALQGRRTPYAAVPAALLELAGEEVRPVSTPAEASVDESWSEPPAFGGCSSQGQSRPGAPQPVQFVRKAQQSGAST